MAIYICFNKNLMKHVENRLTECMGDIRYVKIVNYNYAEAKDFYKTKKGMERFVTKIRTYRTFLDHI